MTWRATSDRPHTKAFEEPTLISADTSTKPVQNTPRWLVSDNSTLQAMNNAREMLAAAEDPPGPPTLLRFDSRCVVEISQLNKKWKRPAVAGRGLVST